MWFTESALVPAVLCAGIAAVLLQRGLATRSKLSYGGALLLLGVAAGIVFLERQIVTDAEQVRLRVEELVYGFRDQSQSKRDSEPLLKFIAEDATAIQMTLKAALVLVTVEDDLSLADVQIQRVDADRFLVTFRANATVSAQTVGNLGHHPSRWRTEWQRKNGEFRMTAIERLNPVNGQTVKTLEL